MKLAILLNSLSRLVLFDMSIPETYQCLKIPYLVRFSEFETKNIYLLFCWDLAR